jgi:hypothetical protein
MVRDDLMLLAVGAGVLFVGAWYLQSRLGNIVEAAPQFVADTAASAVIGTGAVFGIPRTDETECQKALREGRTWDASFACPAGTFIGSIFD